ncbi:voltage-gated chloride channel family protein [Turneriella parva]|uniref:Cl-channel voltage-gated family protein n=1 Tax=Turneriella parva (strain ATCC BAA-1111 / DSM 21527 / NCTC 11395 / H) TaxID=869212 RepID=I4B5S2_TURPD|nr:voltage-gated chloride channel family protein [Turneriella parva]AFM12629.1 Cl- channel voltage-gated family protein [Turneriella parva DSM 21527]
MRSSNLLTSFAKAQLPRFIFGLRWLTISALVGSIAGTASAWFLISLNAVTGFREAHAAIIWLLPVAGLVVGALYHFWAGPAEQGNNLLIDAIHDPVQRVPLRMAPLVYVGTMITHLFGGSAGREGTALQMSASLAHPLVRLFKMNAHDKRLLLIAAISAGFGSVFGTPLAGAIFALEVFLVGSVRYDAIFPAFAAGILANYVGHLWHAPHTVYRVGAIPPLDANAFVWAMAAGLIFGIVAWLFSHGMHRLQRTFKVMVPHAVMRPVVGGLIVAVAVYFVGTRYIGLGVPVIEQAFAMQAAPHEFVLKIAFTILTLAAGFKGGEVTPLFFIGAVLGSALSIFMPLPVGLLAAMGFVAVFAGATNTPLACTVMAMELFGADAGVYAAIACVIAFLSSGKATIYTKQQRA